MPFGIDETLSTLSTESKEEIKKQVDEVDSSASKPGFNKSDFESATREHYSENQLEQQSFDMVEMAECCPDFSPERFNSSFNNQDALKSDIADTEEVSTTAGINITEVSREVKSFSGSNESKSSNISFGNRYDDRAISFLNDCHRYGIDLPTSVTHADTSIDRHSSGGFLSIDKTLMETSLKNALVNGKISQDEYEKLHNKLISC